MLWSAIYSVNTKYYEEGIWFHSSQSWASSETCYPLFGDNSNKGFYGNRQLSVRQVRERAKGTRIGQEINISIARSTIFPAHVLITTHNCLCFMLCCDDDPMWSCRQIVCQMMSGGKRKLGILTPSNKPASLDSSPPRIELLPSLEVMWAQSIIRHVLISYSLNRCWMTGGANQTCPSCNMIRRCSFILTFVHSIQESSWSLKSKWIALYVGRDPFLQALVPRSANLFLPLTELLSKPSCPRSPSVSSSIILSLFHSCLLHSFLVFARDCLQHPFRLWAPHSQSNISSVHPITEFLLSSQLRSVWLVVFLVSSMFHFS